MPNELDELFDELGGDDEKGGEGTGDAEAGGTEGDDETGDETDGETGGETGTADDDDKGNETGGEEGNLPPDEDDDLTILRNQNAALLARLNALESVATPAKPAGATEETKPPVAESGKPKFLTDEDDIDDILSEREKLEGLLQRVYERAREDALPQEYRNLPSFLGEQVQRQMVLREGIREFFNANSDLLAVRKTVGAVTNEVVAEHPDWNLAQVLTEAETRTRTLLGIKKPKVKTDERNPALGGKGSSRKKTGDNRTAMQKEIDDLIDL